MRQSEYKNIFQNEHRHFYYKATHMAVEKLLLKYAQKKSLKILDAGCGTGLLIKKLEKYGTVYGVDISKLALKFAKKRRIENLKQASITKLPFKNHQFDLVVSIDVLYHKWVDDDLKALNEFNRILRPGGILIIKVPAFSWLRGHHDEIVLTRHRYTKNELGCLLKKTDFKILRNTYFNFSLFLFALIKRSADNYSQKIVSDLGNPNALINFIFLILTSIERWFLLRLDLPIGLSVISVSKKLNLNQKKKIKIK